MTYRPRVYWGPGPRAAIATEDVDDVDDDSSTGLDDGRLRVLAYEHALEALVIVDLLYFRAHPSAARVGPLGPPYDGLRAAGVVVGRRSTPCKCVIHSSDEHLLDLTEILDVESPRPVLVDVDDVAAWRAAELRMDGEDATVALREDRHPDYDDGGGPRHYRVVVVRQDGAEERFP